jgi:uncharacterized cupin superfamily protein
VKVEGRIYVRPNDIASFRRGKINARQFENWNRMSNSQFSVGVSCFNNGSAASTANPEVILWACILRT